MYGENENQLTDNTENEKKQQIKKQKSIGTLAKKIEKTEKEIAKLEAQLNKKYKQLEELKDELKSIL
jgi:predicted RNase H-like nuclease (RuvC/YqgF family)